MRRRLVPVFAGAHLLSALLVWQLAATAEPRSAPAGQAQPLAQTLTGAARDAFTSAQILLNNGDFAGALTKYQEAYGLSKEPRLLFNMALCERNLHAYARMCHHDSPAPVPARGRRVDPGGRPRRRRRSARRHPEARRVGEARRQRAGSDHRRGRRSARRASRRWKTPSSSTSAATRSSVHQKQDSTARPRPCPS